MAAISHRVNRVISVVGQLLPVFPWKRGHREGRLVCRKGAKTGSDKPYSITSSARARRDAGTSRPSDFVVLRLMTSAYLEGCSIVLLENAWAWKTST